MPPGQRKESSASAPPPRVIPRQELAPERLTGEVGSGAVREKSSTPAPAATTKNREEQSMMKSKTTRALLAAGCIAGSACVSGPQHRQPPKPADCPPGADATIKRLNILPLTMERIIIHPFGTDYPDAWVSEGPVTGEILPPWGDLPGHTRIYGELFFGKDHVYGRFTRVRLPDGEMAPICLEMRTTKGLGIAMEPGSTSEKARVSNIMSVDNVLHFQ
jgi:serine/threonine-protein kinase